MKTALYTPEQHERIQMGMREHWCASSASDPTTVRIEIAANLVGGFNARHLQTLVARAVAHGHRWFTLDLRHCPYADPRGHRELDAVVRFVREHGGGVTIANANNEIQRRFAERGIAHLVRLTTEPSAPSTPSSDATPRPLENPHALD